MANDRTALWVEILSRSDEVVARHRVNGATEEVRIGRGYDNDIIVDDPYVSPRHLRIVREPDGTLVAEDLGSANGLLAGADRRRVARAVLDGERSITIGHTRLRVRTADHAVAPERISRPRMRSWPWLMALCAALLGAEVGTLWLGQTSEDKLGDYLGPLVALCLAVAAWTTLWAVLSRIFAGRARYERHLLIAICALLAAEVVTELGAYAAFAFSRRELVAYQHIALWLLGAVTCFLHLRQLSGSRETSRSRLRWQASAAATLALLGIGLQSLYQWEASASTDRVSYLRVLKPPVLRLAAAQAESVFFAEISKMKPELDRARAERPGRVLDFGSDDEDD